MTTNLDMQMDLERLKSEREQLLKALAQKTAERQKRSEALKECSLNLWKAEAIADYEIVKSIQPRLHDYQQSLAGLANEIEVLRAAIAATENDIQAEEQALKMAQIAKVQKTARASLDKSSKEVQQAVAFLQDRLVQAGRDRDQALASGLDVNPIFLSINWSSLLSSAFNRAIVTYPDAKVLDPWYRID